MKKRVLSFILTFSVLLTIVITAQATPIKQFSDVCERDWYCKAVNYVTSRGLFAGTSEKTFSPNQVMTRGMLVTVLGRNSKVDISEYQNGTQFSDVDYRKYYAPYISWSHSLGIVAGLNKNRFGPEYKMTREQLATFLYRYAQVSDYNTTINNDDFYTYNDYDLADDYAVVPLRWAVSHKFINGDDKGNLNPKGYASRAMVAQVLSNARLLLSHAAPAYSPDPIDPNPDITPEPTAKPILSPSPSPSPSPKPDPSTVYWVDNGVVYHYTEKCVSLKRSKKIRSGTIDDANRAGKYDKCNLCF